MDVHTLRRKVAPRRLVVAILVGIAVVCSLSALRPAAAHTTAIWVAAHDLPGGTPIAAGDLRVERLPAVDVPAGALSGSTSVAGRLLAGPMRRGEPLTDVHILSAALLAATDQPDAVAVPVRVDDGPAALALVHAGDRVDVLAVSDGGGSVPGGGSDPADAGSVVHDVRVLATPTRRDDASTGDTAGLLIVEASHRQATALARAAAGYRLSVAVRSSP
jgi:Flp pilus assembly protein CpaB